MSRRSALPGAAELFRSTGEQEELVPVPPPAARAASDAGDSGDDVGSAPARPGPSRAQRLLDEPAPGPTAVPLADHDDPAAPGDRAEAAAGAAGRRGRATASGPGRSGPTGRERHDEKITVYVSVDELLDLERARLSLRGDHGLAVDRGRIVREALAVVLADLELKGTSSTLVQRLRSR